MHREIIAALGLDPAASWAIGDTTSDVEAGRAAGMKTALLFDTKRCELCPLRNGPAGNPEAHAARFDELAQIIAGR